MVVLIDTWILKSWLAIPSGIVKTMSEVLNVSRITINHEKWTYWEHEWSPVAWMQPCSHMLALVLDPDQSQCQVQTACGPSWSHQTQGQGWGHLGLWWWWWPMLPSVRPAVGARAQIQVWSGCYLMAQGHCLKIGWKWAISKKDAPDISPFDWGFWGWEPQHFMPLA